MWVRSHYVTKPLANALNSRMCAEDRLPSFFAAVGDEKRRSRNNLRSYPEIVDYLFKKLTTDQPIAKNDAPILR